jgi:hypothetical protein
MRARRLLGFGAVLLSALLAWSPAAHAATPTGGWTDPAATAEQDGVPLAYIEAPQQLKGAADIQNGVIAQVDFSVAQDADAEGAPCAAGKQAQTAKGNNRSHLDYAFNATFPCNRKYMVRAHVVPCCFVHQPRDFDLWVGVAIPSAPTAGLVAAYQKADRGVKLTWDDGPREADFAGFQVRRAIANGSFQAVADVAPGVTTWTDGNLPRNGATLRYQVVAMRPGPDAGTTVFSDDGATVTSVVPAAPGGTGSGSSDDPSGGGTDDGATPRKAGSGVPKGSASSKVHREFSTRGSSSKTPTTIDTGYDETLPFKQGEGDEAIGESVAQFDDDGGGGGTGRSTALLVGGASVTTAWAALLRLVTRRALVY